MKRPLKISIITASYNSSKTILDTFESIRSQEYDQIEYIVVDGGSTDATVEIIKNNEDIISKWISEPDKGIYDAMNKGIALATGDVIGILNSDDFYSDSEVIKNIVETFQDKKVDSVYSNLQYVDPVNLQKIDRLWRAGKYSRRKFKYGWMPPHPTFFVRREIYERFGKFNLELKSAADYEFMLRVLYKHKISSCYLNQLSVVMRSGGNSNASLASRLNGNREDRLAWKKNDLDSFFFTAILKPIRKIPQFIYK